MRVERTLEALSGHDRPVALAIGVFDGVHVGHRAVLAAARQHARTPNGEAWVLTFDPHPLDVLRPADAPPAILSLAGKLRRFAQLGMDGCVVHPFTPAFAALDPPAFFRRLLDSLPQLTAIAVGETWRFGRGAAGDIHTLRQLAEPVGITIVAVPPVCMDGRIVSSTMIRQAVQSGDLAQAARWLGECFSFDGIVVRGRAFGRRIGVPTANLEPPPRRVCPPAGVYAAWVHARGAIHPAAGYIGTRPTFGEQGGTVIEVHLLDTDLALYGEAIEVDWVSRIRDDQAFPDADALRRQIEEDIRQIRRILAHSPKPPARDSSWQDRVDSGTPPP
ncbi:MAG: riboflavin biosynthesis protein RibF [Kiritimatiellae bacterium]|nr:riboflavin biosynthesis protein RibF [Kiritimatiellia bacterium]